MGQHSRPVVPPESNTEPLASAQGLLCPWKSKPLAVGVHLAWFPEGTGPDQCAHPYHGHSVAPTPPTASGSNWPRQGRQVVGPTQLGQLGAHGGAQGLAECS